MSQKKNKRILLKNNVYDEALERINWVFDEFDNVVVGYSGGKDSTVTFELALQVARERGRLPLKVLFLDQEAEWDTVIDHVRDTMTREEVEPLWMQIPFQIFNATSTTEHWLMCWDPEKDGNWIRPKEEFALKDNIYNEVRFNEMFTAFFKTMYPDQNAAYLAGMRAEESPNRYLSLTQSETYKGRTWGKILSRERCHYTFYPIYDWSFTDVWKSIHENQWDYCKIYDIFYQYGISTKEMRVSNLHHETAVRSLFILQEIEPENYNRVVARLEGIDMTGKMQENFFCPKELPEAFGSWKEYRDYLVVNLLDEKWHQRFKDKFYEMDMMYEWFMGDKLHKRLINSVLTNDHEFVKVSAISVPKKYYDEFKRRRDAFRSEQRVKRAAKAANRKVRRKRGNKSSESSNEQSEPSS